MAEEHLPVFLKVIWKSNGPYMVIPELEIFSMWNQNKEVTALIYRMKSDYLLSKHWVVFKLQGLALGL
jgi:hypothetical protein